jgi:sialate O-acetylesterase
MKMRILSASLMAALLLQTASGATFSLAPIFGDNMVLQQGVENHVWGKAPPGTCVSVELAGTTATGKSDPDGHWRVTLPVLGAGGPYEMRVKGSVTNILRNVMVGEVWVSSGQSNMDFRLEFASHSHDDITFADLPLVRYLRVPQIVSRTPVATSPPSEWAVCNPTTAGNFSAVAFYFARALSRDRHVAVGLINTTWSGTPAEAWISAGALKTHPDFKQQIEVIEKPGEDWGAAESISLKIDAERDAVFANGTAGIERGAARLDFCDASWPLAEYPVSVSKMHAPDYCIVWLRKDFELPTTSLSTDCIIDLGRCYEWDQTYFNGTRLGSKRWDGKRVYTVPRSLIRSGHNVISVRLYSEWSAGQLGKPGDNPVFTSNDGKLSVSLAGAWRFDVSIEPQLKVPKYYQREPSALFNGMVSPILGYRIKGVLWYQGEGNADRAQQYKTLLPLLINDWRNHWGEGPFPFLIVQLPNFAAADWTDLREAQSMATSLPNVGMVVTLDVGDPQNLHPANKQPVGERLSLAARHIAYGESCIWTGPVMNSAKEKSGAMIVSFREIGSGLCTPRNETLRGFELKGIKGGYISAYARIEGDHVIVSSPSVTQPAGVRYGWASDPNCNLYNREGLPAAPFLFEHSVGK